MPETRRLGSFRRLDPNDPRIGSRSKLTPRDAGLFPGPDILSTFARALCEARALPAKELFEAAEVFAAARKTVRGRVVADLCCGHGLGGVLFALMERSVERVLLVDRTRPRSADVLLEVAASVAPWVAPKVEWRRESLKRVQLPERAGVLAIHACGLRTDTALDLALAAGGPFAALPCCRPHRQHPAPESLKNALGADVAIDVHRTMRLESAGYRTAWNHISSAITPMNRLLIAAVP